MKEYDELEFEVIEFANEDVIVTSCPEYTDAGTPQTPAE